jgi:ATP-dependent RNA helicase DeaD
MKISELKVKTELLSACAKLGYTETTPVQEKALPILLEGKDAEVEAPTGTGKTLCYGLPLLNFLKDNLTTIQALILCPTRELAIQVEKEMNKFAEDIPSFQAVTIYGGQKEIYQLKQLKRNPSVVVATPGRILDFLKRKKLDISSVSYLVLDECDEMLDMGFIKDIDSIISSIKSVHQTSLYSATISEPIRKISKKYLKEDFVSIKVVRDEEHLHQIDQKYVLVPEAQKKEALVNLINSIAFTKAFVFARTKHKVKMLQSLLQDSTIHTITSLQGNLSQNKRDKAMEEFKDYTADLMVATDIAARGIDVSDVDLVINYDAPEQDEFYLHRIGRTGRVEAKGTSYTFLTKAQLPLLKRYESLSKAKIEKYEIPVGGKIMNKYLLSIEKDLKENHDAQMAEIKEACDKFTEVEGRTVLPIEVAAILLAKAEEEATTAEDAIPSEKHFESIERNREKKREEYDVPGMTRYFVNIGLRDNFDEKSLVAFLQKQDATLVPEDFGSVYMKEGFSFFSIKSEKEPLIEAAMKDKDLDGRALRIDKSTNRDGEGKPRTPRAHSDSRSHSSYHHDGGGYRGGYHSHRDGSFHSYHHDDDSRSDDRSSSYGEKRYSHEGGYRSHDDGYRSHDEGYHSHGRSYGHDNGGYRSHGNSSYRGKSSYHKKDGFKK